MKQDTKIILSLVDHLNSLYFACGVGSSSSFIIQLRVLCTSSGISSFVFQLCLTDSKHKVMYKEFDTIGALFRFCQEHDLTLNYNKTFLTWISKNF